MERRILITGANGQLGRAVNQLLKDREEYSLINTSLSESSAYCPIKLDITNPMGVMNLIQDVRPQVIINCAAHTQVDLCESDQERAYAINALGPKHLAEAAQAVEARLIHIMYLTVRKKNLILRRMLQNLRVSMEQPSLLVKNLLRVSVRTIRLFVQPGYTEKERILSEPCSVWQRKARTSELSVIRWDHLPVPLSWQEP
jgi:hypothetical protein